MWCCNTYAYKIIIINEVKTKVLFTCNIETCNQIVSNGLITCLKVKFEIFIILELFCLQEKIRNEKYEKACSYT